MMYVGPRLNKEIKSRKGGPTSIKSGFLLSSQPGPGDLKVPARPSVRILTEGVGIREL